MYCQIIQTPTSLHPPLEVYCRGKNGPVPFSISINDETECTLSMFAHVPTCEEWLIHHRVVLPSKGKDRLEIQQTGASEVQQKQCRALQHFLGADHQESSLAPGNWGLQWTLG